MISLTFLCALVTALTSSTSALYSSKDNVLQLNKASYGPTVMKTMQPVILELFAPWCGHCKNLAPEYAKAAASLEGLVKVAAIDCDVETNKQLCAMHDVKGFPTIKVFSGGLKTVPEDYNGPRTAAAIVDYAVKTIKSFSKGLTTVEKFTEFTKGSLAKVVLLADKAEPSYMYKALSADFYERLDFAHVKSSDSDVVAKLPKVEKKPAIIVFPAKEGEEPVIYSGAPKVLAIKEFLSKYAKPAPEGSKAGEKKKEEPKQEPFDPIVPEITSQADLNTFCIDKPGVCVVGFLTLESDFPESVEAHKANLAILSALKKKYYDLKSPFHFAWINFINHGRKLAKDFDVSDMLPALLAVNGNKKVYRLLRTAFDESSISSFLGDMMAGLGRNSVYDFTPQLDKETKKPDKKAAGKKDDGDIKEEL